MDEKEPQEIWESLSYLQRLAATAYIFEQICKHAREGGTYRFLIYDRLGFNMDAYSHLYPEGMLISNGFDLKEE